MSAHLSLSPGNRYEVRAKFRDPRDRRVILDDTVRLNEWDRREFPDPDWRKLGACVFRPWKFPRRKDWRYVKLLA